MDGVIAQTEPLHFKAFRYIFEPLDIKLSDEYLFSLVGDPTIKNLHDISRDFCIMLDIKKVDSQLESIYLKLLRKTRFGATPGLWDLIEKIKHRDWKLALCTSSTREQAVQLIDKIIEYDKPIWNRLTLFDSIVTVEDVKNKKPHPEPYLLAASTIGLEPNQCIAIEDSQAGVKSAYTAGCYTIALLNYYNQQNFPFAHKTIKSFSELLNGTKL
ncbi:HAD family phosphatase [candidate division KSB1 bacterium]|nr:HAD family phosphatase [candidate division KSB1 bacterium]